MGGVLNRPVLPSAADGEHIPERDEQRAQDIHVEFDEDAMRRWISIATFGVLVLLTGLLVAIRLPALSGSSELPFQMVLFGVGELLVGTFLAFIVYPPAIGWVALASFFTIAVGVVLASLGVNALWDSVWGLIPLGSLCVAVGAWRGVVSWNEIRRDDLGPSPT